MKKCMFIFFLMLASQFHSFAQIDSGFINNYRQFRTIVDTLPSYTVYLVPFQSKDKIMINESEIYLKQAFHFLKEKKINKNKTSFIIGVLIDDLVTDYPSYYFVQNGEKKTSYQVVISYRLSFNLIIYTGKGTDYHFNLCKDKEFKKESLMWVTNQLTDPWTTNKYNKLNDIYAEILQQKWVFPDINDYRKNLEDVLKGYMNSYVDGINLQ